MVKNQSRLISAARSVWGVHFCDLRRVLFFFMHRQNYELISVIVLLHHDNSV